MLAIIGAASRVVQRSSSTVPRLSLPGQWCHVKQCLQVMKLHKGPMYTLTAFQIPQPEGGRLRWCDGLHVTAQYVVQAYRIVKSDVKHAPWFLLRNV